MATVDSLVDNVYYYGGSLLNFNGTLIASLFSLQPIGNLIYDDPDDDNTFEAGDPATWNGEDATFIGSGTATVGINLGLFTINLSSSVPVNVFETADGSYVEYPEGQPAELFDGLVSQIFATPLIGFTLSLLGLTSAESLLSYVEQNALLNFNLNPAGGMVTCFERTTLIGTPTGLVPIHALQSGDLVLTKDHGPQPIRWHGKSTVRATGRLAPVVIKAGTFSNETDLIVSPQHRILLTDWRAEIVAGAHEVFCPAIHLVNDTSITCRTGGMVEYHHLMFDRHEVIFSNGVPTESFHPGHSALNALDDAGRTEIFGIFPELEGMRPIALPPIARPVTSGHEGRLIGRMV